jgi:hypothetical protein
VGSSSLYLVAPEGQPWPISLEAAEASLRAHWPAARITRQTSAVNGATYLSFDVTVNGTPRWGTYADRTGLSLSEGSPADWADTIAWFLTLLPAGSTALAAAEENPELTPLPPEATAPTVRELYERLVLGE